MKKFLIPAVILILITIAAITVFLIPPVRDKIFGIKLEYKYKQGETDFYKSNMNMEFLLPLPAIVQLTSKISEIGTALNMDSSLSREISQLKGKNAVVVTTMRIEKLKLSLYGKDISPDIQAGLEKKIVFTANPQGQILESENGTTGQDDEIERFSAGFVFFQGWITLPEKPVRPGDGWQGETDTGIGGKSLSFRLKGPVSYKFESMLLYKGRKCAQINFNGEYETETVLKTKGIEMDMNATAKLTGKAYFDPEKGRLMLLTRDINVDISKTIPLTGTQLSGKAKYQIRTESDP